MADFKLSFDKLMRWESFVLENVSGDIGGITCAGISRVYNPQWPGWDKIDAMIKSGAVDIEKVRPEVMAFYEAEYFPLEKVTSQKIADQIFQGYINVGRIGKKWAQIAAGLTGDDVDGLIGEQTLAALNAIYDVAFCPKYGKLQKAYYDAIIIKNPSQEKFRKGWYARLEAFI